MIEREKVGQKSHAISLKGLIANVMNNNDIISSFAFTSERTEMASEFCHSKKWSSIVDEVNSKYPYCLPLVLLVFYDDFRKFRHSAGSAGGLYISFMNMPRDDISLPQNIFCYSLVHDDDEYWEVCKRLAQELIELSTPHVCQSQLIENAYGVSVVVRLGMHLADTPQRHYTCGLMSYSSDACRCVNCDCTVSNCINSPSRMDPHAGVTHQQR